MLVKYVEEKQRIMAEMITSYPLATFNHEVIDPLINTLLDQYTPMDDIMRYIRRIFEMAQFVHDQMTTNPLWAEQLPSYQDGFESKPWTPENDHEE